jgi:hypothetical protein
MLRVFRRKMVKATPLCPLPPSMLKPAKWHKHHLFFGRKANEMLDLKIF